MSRKRDDVHPSPGEQPRRRQVTVSEGDRERIERHLERMPLERDALLLAMRQFGTDFDRDAWQTAYEAFSAEEHNRVVQVTGNLRALVDNAVELVRFAATVTGLRPAGRRPSANADIEALRADGALTGEQTYKLVQLKELCDRLRHAYAYVDADDVHTAVHALLKLLPSFTDSYVKWLAEYGVELT
ncbi:MAG: hypothetical protein ACHQE6_04350 [Solirubrobacterales bacterium]